MPTKPRDCVFCRGFKRHQKPAEYSCPLTDNEPCDVCQEMKTVSMEIAHTEKTLADLLKREQELCVKINSTHDDLLTKFPAEVMTHIFKFVTGGWNTDGILHPICPDPFYGSVTERLDKDRERNEFAVSPLLLGSICRKWREIAWSSPEIWSVLIINFTGITKSRVDTIEESLSRSGSLPLFIIVVSNSNEYEMTSLMVEAVNLIRQVSNRCKQLTIRVPPRIMPFLAWDPAHIPLLSKLTIETDFSVQDVMDFEIQLQTKPVISSLHYLALSRLPAEQCYIHWSNIRTLLLSCIAFQDCIQILQNTPCLENLSPLIRFLAIASNKVTLIYGKHILVHFAHLPSLETFSFQGCEDEDVPRDELYRILKSTCALHRLRVLFKTTMVPLNDLSILTQLPSLRFLEVENTEDILPFFLPGLCLTLEHLVITYYCDLVPYTTYDWSIILKLFEHPQRRQYLKTLHITFIWISDEDECDSPVDPFCIEKDVLDEIIAFSTESEAEKRVIAVELRLNHSFPPRDLLEEAINERKQ